MFLVVLVPERISYSLYAVIERPVAYCELETLRRSWEPGGGGNAGAPHL